ncbi:type II toxin-antitoxin system MqsA family antitoxin [Paraburkholderia oxyphila]|uniref:type II toxin-antitoxin system MqsA family antitoxin n=1 Tax=Paraburkholderia oxyphila TaxID=614212 RepID=UPI000694F0B1
MRCPNCGAAELIRDQRDLSYSYKGETTSVPSMTGDFCPDCDEVVFDGEQGDRYADWIAAFQRQRDMA